MTNVYYQEESPTSPPFYDEDIIVKINNVYKIFKTKVLQIVALQGITMEVHCGELLAITGPSGSGKSTLLKCLGGLEQPTIGEIRVGNLLVSSMNISELVNYRKHEVGFVFQEKNLFNSMTVLQNVILPMLITGSKISDAQEKAKKLLKLVRIDHRMTYRPNFLSGGEKQKVAIASALANSPTLVLADEPTGELDSTNTTEIMELLRSLAKEQEKAIIVVTHDPHVAKFCDRILRLEDGRVVGQKANHEEEFYLEVGQNLTLTLPYQIYKDAKIDRFVKINVIGSKIELLGVDSSMVFSRKMNKKG